MLAFIVVSNSLGSVVLLIRTLASSHSRLGKKPLIVPLYDVADQPPAGSAGPNCSRVALLNVHAGQGRFRARTP